MKFEFRAEIKFDPHEQLTGIRFDNFLPLAATAIPIRLGQTQFDVAMAMDTKRHRGWVSDIDLDKLERHHGIRCTGMYVFLWADLDQATSDAITNDRTDEHTRKLGIELLAALEQVHDSLVDFVRNEHQQWQIPPRHGNVAKLQQRLMAFDTRWRCPQGWKIFNAEQNVIRLNAEISAGIAPHDWQHLLAALRRGRFRVQPHRRLIANAFAHFENHDNRAAIIEGVAAWEMVMNEQAARRLAEAQVSYDERDWKNLIERAGLRASTRLFITLAAHLPVVTSCGAEIQAAIELRNSVVHNGQHRFDRNRLNELLRALRTACMACEDPATGPPGREPC